jgi:hypothetical protein
VWSKKQIEALFTARQFAGEYDERPNPSHGWQVAAFHDLMLNDRLD